MLVSQSELGSITLEDIFLQGIYEVNILHFDDRATVKNPHSNLCSYPTYGEMGQSNLFYRQTPSINTTGIVVDFRIKENLTRLFHFD